MATYKVAIVDTTFALVDMGKIVVERLAHTDNLELHRSTVPGFKDLTAASRRAINDGADLVVACGMPGPEPIDESCAQDASGGLQMVQALTGVPVLEVFVHMSEAIADDGRVDEDHLVDLCVGRCEGHADNAALILTDPEAMIQRAGTGRRQGANDVGQIVH